MYKKFRINKEMSWDTSACFKSLCAAYTSFQRQPTDQFAQDLQRQIDALLGMTSHGAIMKEFSPKQLLYAESLSVLVSLINEPNLKSSLYLKSLMALSQLSNDIETKTSLQTTYNLQSSLAIFIMQQSTTSNKQIIIQSINLLQKMTYNVPTVIPISYLQDLIKYLMKLIQSSTATDQSLHSLYCVANLCRSDTAVHSFIKSMDDVKVFYRKLFSYLSHANKSYNIASLSILTSLVINEEIGEKIFLGQNLINIIQLVFNVLITKEELTTRQYAVDLVIQLSNSQRILNVMMSNEMFSTYIFRVLNLLHTTDPYTASKIFELLVSFCEKDKLRKHVVSVFVKQSIMDDETQLPSTPSLSPAQAVLQWISNADKNDMSVQTTIMSMVFLREVLLEIVLTGASNQMSLFIQEVLQILLQNITVNITATKEEKILKQQCQRVTCSFENILSISKDNQLKLELSQKIDVVCLHNLITETYKHFHEDLKSSQQSTNECSHEIVYMVFRGLEVTSAIKHHVNNGTELYTSLIQDDRLIPFISHALSSKSKYLVHAALQLMAEGLKVKEFQFKSLGDMITTHNQSRAEEMKTISMKQMEENTSRISIQASNPLRDISNKLYAPDNNAVMHALSEKLKKKLELKDSKVSDIMEFYEHKLSSLTLREKQMQDLLESKTLAISQSDRLLAQYRCRQAQSDAECLQLRTLLKDSERRCETDSVKMDEYLKTKNGLESTISTLQEQLTGLESIANEHKQLTVIFKEQNQKIESLQGSLVASEEEHQSLSAMHDLLQKNTEKIKSKLECANKRIQLMEEEQNKTRHEVVQRESEISNLQKCVQLKETEINENRKEANDLSKEIKKYEKDVKKLEKVNNDTKLKVVTLESMCSQHEQTIKEKDENIATLHEDLEKQTQIAAMIHNLTSGRMNVSK